MYSSVFRRCKNASFCLRDDDTSYFTSPDELEEAYGEVTRRGPVSLAVVPYFRGGISKGIPDRYRCTWKEYPLHENRELVDYLKEGIRQSKYEIMLHGLYHDEQDGRPEFAAREGLDERVREGRRYLESLLDTRIRVFVPPHNFISRQGLTAVRKEGLNLAGAAGLKAWPLYSPRAWLAWFGLRRWRKQGGQGIPWILDLGDHRELAGNAITPRSHLKRNEEVLETSIRLRGAFCAATHYWELSAPSTYSDEPSVCRQLTRLVEKVTAAGLDWRSVGDILEAG